MKQKLHYYFIRSILSLGRILSKSKVYGLMRWIFDRYYHMKPKRVGIMHANIGRAFPEFSETEIEAFGKKVYIETAKTAGELLLIYHDRLDIDAMILNREEVIERLRSLQAEAPHGIIYIMAHYGNWELLGHFMAKNGFPLVGVVKEGRNRWIEQKILIPFRAKFGNIPVGHSASMIAIAKALKAGKSVSLAIDQVVQPPNGVVVDFFGHPTAATKAIAMLKLKYNPLIVPIFITRVGREQFRIEVDAIVETVHEEGSPSEEKVVVMTQQYYNVIEKQIRKRPEQWLWFYNRWKGIRNAKS